jgi:hypothetical protein
MDDAIERSAPRKEHRVLLGAVSVFIGLSLLLSFIGMPRPDPIIEEMRGTAKLVKIELLNGNAGPVETRSYEAGKADFKEIQSAVTNVSQASYRGRAGITYASIPGNKPGRQSTFQVTRQLTQLEYTLERVRGLFRRS